MTPYFAVLSFITIFSAVMFIIDIIGNTQCNSFQKKNLISICVMIIVICVCEVFSAVLDGAPVKWRFWQITVNFIGFSISPIINFASAKSVFPKDNKRFNFFFIVWGAYVLFMLVCIFLGSDHGIFYVDKNNNYYRGKEFFLFVVFYTCGTVFFFIENLFIAIRFWKRTNIVLIINFLFLLFATVVQTINPTIQIFWICNLIVIINYYLFFESLYQLMDVQTYFLNYDFLTKWKTYQKKPAVIVVAEFDNYAKLKMNYTRDEISNVLLNIAKLFNSYYKSYGRCYRIGSEEFCVVISDTNLDFEKLNKDFFIQLVKYDFGLADMPLVSIGYAKMNPDISLEQALSLADSKKRTFIKERLSYLY